MRAVENLFLIWDENGRVGYIDRTGTVLIAPKFQQAGTQGDFSNGRALFYENNRYGYIDSLGHPRNSRYL